MSSKDIKPADLKLDILDRFSVEDVEMWMCAKLHQMREETGLEMSTLALTSNLSTWSHEQYFYTAWNMHAAGQCAGEETLIGSLATLRERVLGDPVGKAREKRRKAQDLIRDAERLEKIAADGGVAS